MISLILEGSFFHMMIEDDIECDDDDDDTLAMTVTDTISLVVSLFSLRSNNSTT